MIDQPRSVDEPLDLQLLASGATQHVFLRQDLPLDAWVYKIPALVEDLLPSRPAMHRIEPVGAGKRSLYALLYGMPRRLWRRASSEAWPGGRFLRGPGRSPARWYVAAANRLLCAHLRRSRVAAFNRTLRLHRMIRAAGPDECVLLPWHEVPSAVARLHTGGAVRSYRGPILIQRRADVFFDRCNGLDQFEWAQLIFVQHQLWRLGFALTDAAGAFGPYGWALSDGRLLLGDTGSLTDRLDLAARVLAPDLLERVQRSALRQQPDPASLPRVRAYYRLVGAHIHPQRLAELWGTDRPAAAGRCG